MLLRGSVLAMGEEQKSLLVPKPENKDQMAKLLSH